MPTSDPGEDEPGDALIISDPQGRVLAAGCDAYISKPLDTGQLDCASAR